MIATTAERVSQHTSPATADRIRDATLDSIRHHLEHPEDIAERLRELDREWDIERTLETGSASLTLLGLALGTLVNRRWFALAAAVQGFFLQHALQGWCPPLPLLRRLGVRTQAEIERERYALKAIRGDFASVGTRSGRDASPVEDALEAVSL